MTQLPTDIARCYGVGSDSEGWREGCEDCLRRTSPLGERQWWMEPPEVVASECPYRITPK